MTDEGKAGIVTSLWCIAFNAGVLIAAGYSRPIGLTLMICSTLVFATYLAADGRLEAEKRRRKRYQQDCEKRTREAMRRDDR